MRHLTPTSEIERSSLKRRAKRLIRQVTGYDLHKYTPPDESRTRGLVDSMTAAIRDRAIKLDYGVFDVVGSELHITHLAGLYSCITVTLWHLTDLLSQGYLPRKINFARTLDHYKNRAGEDIYPELFASDLSPQKVAAIREIPRSEWKRFDHHGAYGKLDFVRLNLLIATYFQPHPIVAARVSEFRQNHLRAGSRYVGVCFRGTDKATEVLPIDSAIYLKLAERLLKEGRAERVFIQTDQQQVAEVFKSYFGESCDLIEKIPRTLGTIAIHNDAVIEATRLEFARDLIAAVNLLAGMDEVIVYTGNIGAWVVLTRGSPRQVWQAMPNGIHLQ